MTRAGLIALAISVATLGAQSRPAGYASVLDRTGLPVAMKDVIADGHQQYSPLFDLGSWHGYLLPADSADYGGFPGPMVVAEEYAVYLARQVDQLALVDAAGHERALTGALVHIESRAGLLTQEYRFDDLVLRLALRMASGRSAVIVTTMINTGRTPQVWRLRWRGALLDRWDRSGRTVATAFPTWTRALQAQPAGLDVTLGIVRSPQDMMLSAGAGLHIRRSMPTTTRVSGLSYVAESAPITLAEGATRTILSVQTYVLTADEWPRELTVVEQWLAAPGAFAQRLERDTDRRWRGYLTRALRGVPADTLSQRLAQKAVETLIGNWRSPAGAIRHDGIVPSTVSQWFNGLWAWDTWKHVAAIASVDPALGRRAMESMFDYQVRATDSLRPQDAGMVIDAVFYNRNAARGGDGENWNERNSKPPLAVWAVLGLHDASPDRAWLARMYPKLAAYHRWWWRLRDHNRNGLAEYGATADAAHADDKGRLRMTVDGQSQPLLGLATYDSLRAAGKRAHVPVLDAISWESGMDNAARFGDLDDARLRTYAQARCHGDLACARRDWTTPLWEQRDSAGAVQGYSLAQESVDLNAFLAADAAGLSRIAATLGKQADAAHWALESRTLAARVQACFWDDTTHFFYDRDVSDTTTDARGCTGHLLTRRGRGSEAWVPLWAGIATAAQARALGDAMEDPKAFGGGLPLPTAARDNPGFGPQLYWRGRVWADQLFFALDGLRRSGDTTRADRLWQRFVRDAQGVTGSAPLHENYDPDTGAPLGAPNFSFTAAHLLLWLEGKGGAPRLR